MIQPLINCLLVKVDFHTKESYVSENGLEIFLDPDLRNTELHSLAFNQTDYRQTSGTVMALPRGFSQPHYFYDNLIPNIEVGDRIHFHYTAIDLDSRIEYQGETLYAVPYEMVWCKVKDGELSMVGGRIFCEELPYDDVQEIEVNGVKIKARLSKSGIVLEMNVKHDLNKARLVHIGTPMKDQPTLDVKPGDTIYYATDSDFENIIEGKKYFCMMQEDILAKEI